MAAYAFWVALIAVALAALRYGERPERLVAVAYVAAALASGLLWPAIGRYRHLERSAFIVDVMLLAVLLVITLDVRRWWLVIASVLQMVTVLGHVAKLIRPDIWPLAYAWMMQASSFPSLAALAVGVLGSIGRRRACDPGAQAAAPADPDAR